MKKRLSLIFCVLAAVVCVLSIGASAATYSPDNDGLYTVALDMEPNCEYVLFALKGNYDQTNYIEAYRTAEDSDILYFEQKNSESDGSVVFGPFAPAGYYYATLVLGGTNIQEPVLVGHLSVDGVSNAASIELSGIASAYTVDGVYGSDITVEIKAKVLDSFGYPSLVESNVAFEISNNSDDVTLDGNVVTIGKTAEHQVFSLKASSGNASKTVYVTVNRLAPVYTSIELYEDADCTKAINDSVNVVGVDGKYPSVTIYAKSFDQYGDEIADEHVYTYDGKNVSSSFEPKEGTVALVVSSRNSAISKSINVITRRRPDYAGPALELYNLIKTCKDVLAEDKNISVDGRDVFPNETWTTQYAIDNFSAAVSAAENALAYYGSAGYFDNDYSDEVTVLTNALNAYRNSFRAGVRVDIEAISLNTEKEELLPNGVLTLTATVSAPSGVTDVLTWTSSDSNIVAITNSYNNVATVKATGYGTATITVTTRAGLSASAQITVIYKANAITLSPYQSTVVYGSDPLILTAQIKPKGTNDRVEWIVGNPDVADIVVDEYVDTDGFRCFSVTIVPKSSGMTGITATTVYGKKSSYSEVTVVMPDWDKAPKPVASIESGSVLSGTEIVLSSPVENAKIYYTLDGTDPTVENARIYTTPIAVTTNLTLKAITVGKELYNSDVATYEYRVVDAGVYVGNDTVQGGEKANVEIFVEDIENAKSAVIVIDFDSEYLAQKANVTTTALDGIETECDVTDGQVKLYLTKEDGFTYNGAIANIELIYTEDAPEGNYPIYVSSATITPVNGELYSAAAHDGSVIINNYIVGDANDDGKISLADVLLVKQYIAGNENAKRKIVLGAADADADGDVDNDDVTLLSKYCLGWNVVLGKQPEDISSYRIVSNYDYALNENEDWMIMYEVYDPYTGAKVSDVPSAETAPKASGLNSYLVSAGQVVNLVDGKVDKSHVISMTGVTTANTLGNGQNMVWIAGVDETDKFFEVVPYQSFTNRDLLKNYIEAFGHTNPAQDMYGKNLCSNFIEYTADTVVSVMTYSDYNTAFWNWGTMSLSDMSDIAAGKKELLCYHDKYVDSSGNYHTKYADYVMAYVSVTEETNSVGTKVPVADFVIVLVHGNEGAALDA